MPADFISCQKAGGRIRTIKGPNEKYGLKKNEYVHVCFLKGKMTMGEKHYAAEKERK